MFGSIDTTMILAILPEILLLVLAALVLLFDILWKDERNRNLGWLTAGGMLETKKIADYAERYGLPTALHFAGSPIAFMANLHCANCHQLSLASICRNCKHSRCRFLSLKSNLPSGRLPRSLMTNRTVLSYKDAIRITKLGNLRVGTL